MNSLLMMVTCAVLSYICYEDLKFRAVKWMLFPVVWILGMVHSVKLHNSFATTSIHLAVNYFLIGFNLLVLLLYSKWKNNKLSDLMGTGDVLFLFAAAAFFSPFNFLVYCIISLLLTLLLHVLFLYHRLYPNNEKTVPLAGFQAIALAITVMAVAAYPGLNINDDTWLLYKLQLL